VHLESEALKRSCSIGTGGPERLSRLDMALKVAETYGFNSQPSVIAVPSASVNRGVASPADISMAIDRWVYVQATTSLAVCCSNDVLQSPGTGCRTRRLMSRLSTLSL
jgi:hypothetical protein